MVKPGNRKHSQRIETDCNPHSDRADTHPEHGKTGEMQGNEWECTQPVKFSVLAIIR